LSLIEVALGSVLHSFRIPFSGNFLSLNQGYLLCRATLEARKIPGAGPVAFGISNVAAVLKSLAPAGKKLGPMLSLGMQGLLFQIGVSAFGASLPGLMLGMALLSLWTFLQPLITYYLFFGTAWFTALNYLFEKTVPYHGLSLARLGWILAALVMGKMVVAMGLAVLARRNEGRADIQDRLLVLAREKGVRPLEGKPGARRGSALWLALRDLTHPLFLFSMAATVFFLAFSQHGWDERFWILLRPLAIGFLFFYFSRTLTLDRWLARLHGTRGDSFARACEMALAELRRFTNGPKPVKQETR
jgi:hypothetical protein